jgi:hypothetical protein
MALAGSERIISTYFLLFRAAGHAVVPVFSRDRTLLLRHPAVAKCLLERS